MDGLIAAQWYAVKLEALFNRLVRQHLHVTTQHLFAAPWLADFHTVIRAALAKKIEQPTLFKDLEDALIHFTHAGYVKAIEHVDPVLRAQNTADYLKGLASIVAVLVEGGGACVNICLNDARPKRAWILCKTPQNAVSHKLHTPPLVHLKEERTTTSDQHSETVH